MLNLNLDAARRTFHAHAEPVPVDLAHFDLPERLYELPPPGEWPLQLIGTKNQLEAAQGLLQPRGWQADELEISCTTSRHPPDSTPYRPNSFLAAVLAALELDASDEVGLAVDLGCGSGRDAVYLADRLLQIAPRWNVLGLDNHEAALGRGRALAARARPSPPRPAPSLTFEHRDLRKGGLEAALAARPMHPLRLVHGCRWLDAPLLASLPELLEPGGYLLWSTFVDPPDGSAPLKPPFRRSRRLSSGQMRELIGESAGMRVLYDEEGELLTRGTWCTAQFYAAQRLPSA